MRYSKPTPAFFKLFLPLFVFSIALLFSCSSDENIFIIPSDDNDLYQVHFIDVGQGDAILVTTPGKTLLVDGGWQGSGVDQYLTDLGISKVDIVIGTHPHADHIGGLIAVFQRFEVGEVIDPGVTHTTATFNNYLTAIDIHDIPFTVGRKGMERQLSEHAYFEIIHPINPASGHLNNASIVVRVHLGDIKVLLTGDAERESEQSMLSAPELLRSHILKVGHHGSRTSSTMPFLEAVQPEVSIIMCGRDNPYGHPHSQAMQALNAVGTDIYRTDTHGHILIETDGTQYSITTEK